MSEESTKPEVPEPPPEVVPAEGAQQQAPLTGGAGHQAKIDAQKERDKEKAREQMQAQSRNAATPTKGPRRRKRRRPRPQQPAEKPAEAAVAPPPTPEPAPTALASFDPLSQELALRVADQQKPSIYKYYLVVTPDDDWPRVEKFETLDEFREAIVGYLDTPVSLQPFMGVHFQITKPPHRFLVTHMGNVPLFEIPDADELEQEDDGWVGKPRHESEIPEADAAFEDDLEEEEAEEGETQEPPPELPAPPDEDETPMG